MVLGFGTALEEWQMWTWERSEVGHLLWTSVMDDLMCNFCHDQGVISRCNLTILHNSQFEMKFCQCSYPEVVPCCGHKLHPSHDLPTVRGSFPCLSCEIVTHI